METWVCRKTIYTGHVVSVEIGDVLLEDGVTAFREVVRHPGGVAVVPFHDDAVVLIRQYRIAIGQSILELPAGKLEGNEDPLVRGRQELEEETGYRAGKWVSAGSTFASVGYSSEEIRLFLAFDLEKTRQNLEDDERIETVELPLPEVRAGLARNEIKDAKTIVGLYALLEYLDRGKRAV